ncbi:Cysteine-rich membrane protein 2 [Spironucleus salmonicida]|uniref:Cysteine-rich membrane protein 2 n=1 Tax=Spironucleus salmonicida TaxID=348837 RepID=V6LHK2_9EUKA|nr:Cysteine-rich membrane protein 2 [Spironucleus salmonicida]|eukprot:EST43778.1 Cysteine-rich membrane protein 2 [Spironucleus salmonicida]
MDCGQQEILINDTCLIDTCDQNCHDNGQCVQSTENPIYAVCKCNPGYDFTKACAICARFPHSILQDQKCYPANCGNESCYPNGICKLVNEAFVCRCESGMDAKAFCKSCPAGTKLGDSGACEVATEAMPEGSIIGLCVSVCVIAGAIVGVVAYRVIKHKQGQKQKAETEKTPLVGEGSAEKSQSA